MNDYNLEVGQEVKLNITLFRYYTGTKTVVTENTHEYIQFNELATDVNFRLDKTYINIAGPDKFYKIT